MTSIEEWPLTLQYPSSCGFDRKPTAAVHLRDFDPPAGAWGPLHRKSIALELAGIAVALNRLAERYGHPVIWSVHPRTRPRLSALGLPLHPAVRCCVPFDLFDFVRLEQAALCVLTDSGTVQEECCIFHVAAVTMRDTTERPETVECGSNVLAGCDPDRIVTAVDAVTQRLFDWTVPREYLDPHVSEKVVRFVLGNTGRTPVGSAWAASG